MSYFLSPINSQIVDANGDPLSGGKIYTYQAGTTTPIATYTDSTGGTAQANPIILNSLGVPASPIWLQGGVTYKFVIKDSADATQRTIDGITGVNDVSSSAAEWNESGFVPTYINATQFSVPGDQTSTLHVNRRVRTRNTAGYVYGRISVSSYGASITTVTVVNDSGTLDSGLSAVAYGFLSFTPSSVPYAMYASAGANGDITSLTNLSAGGLPDNSVLTADIADAQVTPAKLSQPRTRLALTATTSGSSHGFTGIASWATEIVLSLDSVSTGGSTSPYVQIGDSGGLETSGYTSTGYTITGTPGSGTSTSGFLIAGGTNWSSTYTATGHIRLTLHDPATNTWVCSVTLGNSGTTTTMIQGGKKALSGLLDRISLVTSDTFDAGSISGYYE